MARKRMGRRASAHSLINYDLNTTRHLACPQWHVLRSCPVLIAALEQLLRLLVGDPAIGKRDVLVLMAGRAHDRRCAMALMAVAAVEREVRMVLLVRVELTRLRGIGELVV